MEVDNTGLVYDSQYLDKAYLMNESVKGQHLAEPKLGILEKFFAIL